MSTVQESHGLPSYEPQHDTILLLEDGTELPGFSFGASAAVGGEVVFNTAMAGYIESLTDPSYAGQILVATYPLIGNYGVPGQRPEGGLDSPYESDRIQVQGLVVQSYIDNHSHHFAERSLGAWLTSEGVSGLTGVDTRTLTRRLREHGTMQGWLFPKEMGKDEARRVADITDMSKEVFERVAPADTIHYTGGELKILLIDVGAKDNIVRSLLERGVSVIRAPWHGNIRSLARSADGIMIGNGPGDPKALGALIEDVRYLLQTSCKPTFGICLGNQILSLAAGGDTYKLPYGHRGVNQPVQDLLTRRCYITSQNHGFAVKDDALPEDWESWFVNVNDGTNEGVRSRSAPFFGVQFHPEACPGPEDTGFLFDEFLRVVGADSRG